MPGRSSTLRIGRLAGIPIGVHPLWLVVVALLTWALGKNYFPAEAPGLSTTAAYALGLASALALFGGILLHELGHAIVARGRGVNVEEIDLWLLGGVSRMTGEPRAPGDELRFALAGPAITLAILVVIAALRLVVGDALTDWLRAFLDYQIYVNAAVLVFNLLPAFPLDGGRVVRALLWRRLGDRQRATEIAARGGKAFGWGLVALGLVAFASGVLNGLWLAIVGGFLIVAAGAEAQGSALRRSFGGRPVTELMSAPPVTLPASSTLEEAIRAGFVRHLFSAFPVVDDSGRATGVLTLPAVRDVPPDARRTVTVGETAVTDEALLVEPQTGIADLLQQPPFLRVGRAVVVDGERRPLGVLSVTDVQRRLRADALLPPNAPVRAP
jgi:Zn-dependent protease